MCRGRTERFAPTISTAIGYSLEAELQQPGIDVFDLTDPAVIARLDGQNDQGCEFRVDGVAGHGYVELVGYGE